MAADCHELMIPPQCHMCPPIACTSGQLDPWCIRHTTAPICHSNAIPIVHKLLLISEQFFYILPKCINRGLVDYIKYFAIIVRSLNTQCNYLYQCQISKKNFLGLCAKSRKWKGAEGTGEKRKNRGKERKGKVN